MIGPIFGRATLNSGKVRNTKQAIHNGHMKLIVIRYCLLNDMKKMSSKWYENYTRFINNIYIRILYINIIFYVHYFSFFREKLTHDAILYGMLVCSSVRLVDVNLKYIINRPYSFTTCPCNRNNEHIFILPRYFL